MNQQKLMSIFQLNQQGSYENQLSSLDENSISPFKNKTQVLQDYGELMLASEQEESDNVEEQLNEQENKMREGEVKIKSQNFKEAQPIFEQALNFFSTGNKTNLQAFVNCKIQLGACLFSDKKFKEAYSNLIEVQKDIETNLKLTYLQFEYYSYLGLTQFQLEGDSNIVESIKLLQDSLQFETDKPTEYKYHLALVLHYLGIIQYSQDKYEESEQFLTKSFNIYQSLLQPQDMELAIQYNNLGEINRLLKKGKVAIEYFEKSIEIQKDRFKDGIDESIANTYQNIALTYQIDKNIQGSDQKAFDNFLISHDIYEKLNQIQKTSISPEIVKIVLFIQQQLAYYSLLFKQADQALRYIQECHDQFQETYAKEVQYPNGFLVLLADVYYFNNKYQDTIRIHSQLLEKLEQQQVRNNIEISRCKFILGFSNNELFFQIKRLCHSETGDNIKAMEFIQESIETLQSQPQSDIELYKNALKRIEELNQNLEEKDQDQNKQSSNLLGIN